MVYVSLVMYDAELSIDDIVSSHKKTQRRVIFVEYDVTVVPQSSLIKAPSAEVITLLSSLSNDPKNTMYIVIGRERSSLSECLVPCERLGIAAEHGYFIRLRHRAHKLFGSSHKAMSLSLSRDSQSKGSISTHRGSMKVDLSKLEMAALWRYWGYFNLFKPESLKESAKQSVVAISEVRLTLGERVDNCVCIIHGDQQNPDNPGRVPNPDDEDLGDDDLLDPINPSHAGNVTTPVNCNMHRNRPFRERQDHQPVQYDLNDDDDGMDGAGATGAIIPPPLAPRAKFNITSTMIQLLHLKRLFGGLPGDDLNMHLENFVTICKSFDNPGVGQNAIRLRLFLLSLSGEATLCLNELTIGSITN
ncbi:putative alpha,alpha-trehalose-phosphate synthase [UDP-forming] 8 [Capsicum baccatum]|uniref:Alpha,alpha-trehalose-phosphate synthase [UDP-forming] 8 n=1 Tax=Capsicum baccatum TaxID=33114 RepID=A0A2G2X776_CAPBA|nr:putative alpha,alpha-trehalose-phosphate synthase [UDP-forming] 8 [Capsicum baccatum]